MITLVAYLTLKMKTKIDGVLIVEGSNDVSYLSSFLDAYYFVTNGLDISQEKIDFLLQASKVNKLIIFTDPDEAGENIKNIIQKSINGTYVASISGLSRKNYKKHGVAEASKNEVLEALRDFKTDKDLFKENYNLSLLVSLSDNPEKVRNKIIQNYNLVRGNNKSVENQLNILKIKKEEVWKLIEATSTK